MATDMTGRSVTHATFVIEREYPAPPPRVFAAWADPGAKAAWFAGPDEWTHSQHALDFRVGGRELNRVSPPGAPEHRYEAVYLDIVPDHRIVYAYEMYVGQARISVSLATVELLAQAAGTRLVFTEQGAYLDGSDDATERERGTRDLLDALARALEPT